MKKVIIANKNMGETPLECLERMRTEEDIAPTIPMTYAGRLDPMAEGVLVVLVGDERKNKEKYLGLDKEYEVEVLFGIETDTHDVLGLIRKVATKKISDISVEKYVRKFNQEYPVYSSKTVDGRQLHEYARAGEKPDEMPAKEVEIYSIEKLGEREVWGIEIAEEVLEKIVLVRGDFRQDEIVEEWLTFGEEFGNILFKIITLKVACSSGTYMRSLAKRIGEDAGTGALAYSIKRLRVGNYTI